MKLTTKYTHTYSFEPFITIVVGYNTLGCLTINKFTAGFVQFANVVRKVK